MGLMLKEQEKGVAVQSLIRLCKFVEGSNRNVTADNWFVGRCGATPEPEADLGKHTEIRQAGFTEDFQANTCLSSCCIYTARIPR